ncbi:MAG TPA: DUF5681 domain-containing protein [Flavisolibacter sp.]|jgi:hypothetical protein|nr:DUF5681 domain-containing protein [Flavisolibacter sp.]
MPFEKGISGNPAGRKPGSTNKSTAQLREIVNNFLSDNFEAVAESFKSLPAKDKVKAYVDLLQYGLPKLQAESSNPFENMTDEQLDEIVNRLKNNL